ncbi:hypothetical protein JCM8208_006588 [Rhodotorula glutinis]
MSDQWNDTCLVCCEKTKNRCSKCAEAGIDLFFCSPKCQRLVWNVHKRVCGPGKANPFMWPLLSEDETRDIIEHLDESTGVLSLRDPERNTVARALQQTFSCTREMVPILIETVTAGKGGQVAAANDTRQQLLLVSIRAFEEARLMLLPEMQTLEIITSREPTSPWCSASGWDVNRGRDELALFDEHGREPWRAKARHMALMYGAVFNLSVRGHVELDTKLQPHRQRLSDHVVTLETSLVESARQVLA